MLNVKERDELIAPRWEPVTYLDDSELYSIKKSFYAEVILDLHKKIPTGIWLRIMLDDLWNIVTRSCNRKYTVDDEFKEKIDLNKIALNVDVISIVSNAFMPVAFSSGKFIRKDLFYLNTAVVFPEYFSLGIGAINTALVCKIVDQISKRENIDDLYYVFRTHNRNVASTMLNAFDEGFISTENHLPAKIKDIFTYTANYLDCEYDPQNGISYDVYPRNMPEGKSINNSRIQKALYHLGPTDACYGTGKMNMKLINTLVARNVKKINLNK